MKRIMILFLLCPLILRAQQVQLSIMDKLTNEPSPYQMKDWKRASLLYDSLVFNLQLTGKNLPLSKLYSNTVNYPEHNSFKLNTVVGTPYPNLSEAINALPAIVGATLCGVDKRNFHNQNWVLMCEEFFNKANGEYIYLNTPESTSGNDGWYDNMPNIFFFQLYNLYGNVGHFDEQFSFVAERYLAALNAMINQTSGAPFSIPNMNFRAWNFKNSLPNKTGVAEPEIAACYSWILYNAYRKTGLTKYRIGAERAMQFLNSLNYNPSYEIQMPYGVYTAAVMNAELNANYDLKKMVNWCFSSYQNRNWGMITGRWGSYDVGGLIGEDSSTSGYAFLMNTFEQAGALIPVVRYDDRYASLIGKWMLNAANSARLLYREYLPYTNQDSYEWSSQYDPQSVIGHESMRQTVNGVSPFATGDAISGNWGTTNLALYGSSHVGIFGSIIETTNVEKILKLNLLKTDFYHKDAYPSFLIYNPYNETKTITFDAGNNLCDIYEAVTNTFLLRAVSGNISLSLPPLQASVIVVTPPNAVAKDSEGKRLVNGVVIDYVLESVANYPPHITSIIPNKVIVTKNKIDVVINVTDKDGDNIVKKEWTIDGAYKLSNQQVEQGMDYSFSTGDSPGQIQLKCKVTDTRGAVDSLTVLFDVADVNAQLPIINNLSANQRKIKCNTATSIQCNVQNSNTATYTYLWHTQSGMLNTATGSTVTWIAPDKPGAFYVSCMVSNNFGSVRDSIKMEIYNELPTQSGNLILYIPCNTDAKDSSGNNNDGIVSGATLVNSPETSLLKAYSFNGDKDNIIVKNNNQLNSNSITVSFWMSVVSFKNDAEQYILSHGSWQQRWKISISNEKLRWTIKTDKGVLDVDTDYPIQLLTGYFVTCVYDGTVSEIYLNGKIQGFSYFTGNLLSASTDLTIGQATPSQSTYNFYGSLDEIKIYNYALPLDQIENGKVISAVTDTNTVFTVYPNPIVSEGYIILKTMNTLSDWIFLSIYDNTGRKLMNIYEGYISNAKEKIKFTMNGYPQGIYHLVLRKNGEINSQKIIHN